MLRPNVRCTRTEALCALVTNGAATSVLCPCGSIASFVPESLALDVHPTAEDQQLYSEVDPGLWALDPPSVPDKRDIRDSLAPALSRHRLSTAECGGVHRPTLNRADH